MDDMYEKQLAAFKRRVGAVSAEDDLLADIFTDAVQAVLDYTHRTKAEPALLIAAKRYAIVLYNQQGDEGETIRNEGGVQRTFEMGIPSAIRSSIAPYRLANVRRFS